MEEYSVQTAAIPQPRGRAQHHEVNQEGLVPLRRDGVEAAKTVQLNSTFSGTEATEYIPQPEDSQSIISTATTTVDVNGQKVELPPPPKAPAGKEFECPYCFIICPAKHRSPRAWRAHLLQDLRPYCCTYLPKLHRRGPIIQQPLRMAYSREFESPKGVAMLRTLRD